MSYRNPKIIDDKSGLIVSQAINQATATLGQGIVAYGAEQKKRREKKAKEDELFSKQIINMANKKAEGDAQFASGLTDLGGTIQSSLGEVYEGYSQRNFELRELQLAGNTDPEVSKEIGRNMQKMIEARTLGEQMIATTAELPGLIENYEAINKTVFLKDMVDPNTGETNGNLSKAIIFGFSGKEDYTASMVNVDGEVRAQVITPDGVTYSIPAKQFKDITENLTLQKVNNAAESQIQFTKNELQDKKGNINQSLIISKEPYNETDANGIQRVGTRNLLDIKSIEAAKEYAIMDTQALLTSSEGNIQLRNLYLDDLNIEPSDYEAADKEGKEKMIKATSERLFDNSSGIIKRGENYYLDTDEKSYNVGIPKAKTPPKEDLAFTEWKETFGTSTGLTPASLNLGLNTKIGNKLLTSNPTLTDNVIVLETAKAVLDDEGTTKKDESKDAEKTSYDLTIATELDAFVRLLPGVSTAKERSEAKALITAKIKKENTAEPLPLTMDQLKALEALTSQSPKPE